MTQRTRLTCTCGQAALELEGRHLVSVECYCNSCRAAGAALESLPGAPKLLEASGATRFVLYRKDRVRCAAGAAQLKEHRLQPASKTRRVVATCCNTPLFLEFTDGHWLSLYGLRWPLGTLPPLEMRTMTEDLPEGTKLPEDVPNGKTQPFMFYVKLIGAWIAMGFRVPRVDFVNGALDGGVPR
ncbi:hypothetical protein WME91_38040 [Sorangium sp. So ce269]